MQMSTRRDEPSKPAQREAPQRGAPASYAAHAFRKNLAVRVLVKPAAPEPDELREDGYGHGV